MWVSGYKATLKTKQEFELSQELNRRQEIAAETKWRKKRIRWKRKRKRKRKERDGKERKAELSTHTQKNPPLHRARPTLILFSSKELFVVLIPKLFLERRD